MRWWIFVIQQLKMRQVELKLYLDYPNCMLRRFSYFFACLLLLLVPLQSIAAVNMSICNSMMQAGTKHTNTLQASTTQTSTQLQAQKMPCHDMNSNAHSNSHSEGKSTCKTSCAALCASLCAMTALPSNMPVASFIASSSLVQMRHQTYVSITQPNLQRPPIFFS